MRINFSTYKMFVMSVFTIFLCSCENNPLEIDVSEIKLNLEVKRFDRDLFDSNPELTAKDVDLFYDNYGIFFQDFTENIINIGSVKAPNLNIPLTAFKSDNYIKEVNTDVQNSYKDFSKYQTKLEDAFKHYKYYFPKKLIPEVVTYVSGFNYAVVTDEMYLGIGLDMFLGSDYKAYTQLGLPQYKMNTMTNNHLVTGVMLAWISTEFELKENNADLLTEMIHQGKLLYLLDALLPNEKETYKLGYSEKEITWCDINKTDVWFHFVDNELLYAKETQMLIKYMGEAPFIQGFPEGSPGKIGHWMGLQIVKAYMKRFPEISVKQLMQEQNAQKILNQSKYKP